MAWEDRTRAQKAEARRAARAYAETDDDHDHLVITERGTEITVHGVNSAKAVAGETGTYTRIDRRAARTVEDEEDQIDRDRRASQMDQWRERQARPSAQPAAPWRKVTPDQGGNHGHQRPARPVMRDEIIRDTAVDENGHVSRRWALIDTAGRVISEIHVDPETMVIMGVDTATGHERQGHARRLYEVAASEAPILHSPPEHRTIAGDEWARAVGGDSAGPCEACQSGTYH